MTITVTCDYCGKKADFKGFYIPEGWHFSAFDTIVKGEVYKHFCPECYEKLKKEAEE